MQSTKPKPINYNKLKVAELTALLEGRGLPSAGTKLQMISRLVCQDAEELAAEKAAAKAIKEALPSAAEEPKDGGKGGGKVKKGKSVRARGGGARKSADKDGEVEESEDVGVSADNGIEDVDKTNEDDTDIPPVSDYILKQMMATLATKQKVSDAASADAVNPDDIIVNMTPKPPTAPATPPRRRRLRHGARNRRNPGPSPLSTITALSTETGDDNVSLSTAKTAAVPYSSHDHPALRPSPDARDDDVAGNLARRRTLSLLLACVFFIVLGVVLAMGAARWIRKV